MLLYFEDTEKLQWHLSDFAVILHYHIKTRHKNILSKYRHYVAVYHDNDDQDYDVFLPVKNFE